MAVSFSGGCGERATAAHALPAGIIAIWGMPGRIDGAFVQPRVIDCMPDGEVSVIDRSGRVQFFSESGRFAGKFTVANTEKGYPTGMTVTPDGRIWIAETHAYRVGVYTREGQEVMAFGGAGHGDGQFIYVTDVAVSGRYVYASDFGGDDRVQQFDSEGRFIRKWGGTGEEPGQFRRPQALAVGADGSIFVADACNDRIQKFSADGECLGVYGRSGTGVGEFLYPYDIAAAPDGTLYIAEFGNCRIQRMTADGKWLGTWGRAGSGPGELAQPWAVALDKKGTLFIVDNGNSRVVVLDPAAAEWSGQTKGA